LLERCYPEMLGRNRCDAGFYRFVDAEIMRSIKKGVNTRGRAEI